MCSSNWLSSRSRSQARQPAEQFQAFTGPAGVQGDIFFGAALWWSSLRTNDVITQDNLWTNDKTIMMLIVETTLDTYMMMMMRMRIFAIFSHGNPARSRLPPLSSGSGSSRVIQKEERPSHFGDYDVIMHGNGNNRFLMALIIQFFSLPLWWWLLFWH